MLVPTSSSDQALPPPVEADLRWRWMGVFSAAGAVCGPQAGEASLTGESEGVMSIGDISIDEIDWITDDY